MEKSKFRDITLEEWYAYDWVEITTMGDFLIGFLFEESSIRNLPMMDTNKALTWPRSGERGDWLAFPEHA